jgi:hypothetical protein
MTLLEIQSMCLTRLCWWAPDERWHRDGAADIFAYRHGTTVVVTDQASSVSLSLSGEEFRTFIAYRALWGYLGAPAILLEALKGQDSFFLERAGTLQPFSPELAQSDTTGFSIRG